MVHVVNEIKNPVRYVSMFDQARILAPIYLESSCHTILLIWQLNRELEFVIVSP